MPKGLLGLAGKGEKDLPKLRLRVPGQHILKREIKSLGTPEVLGVYTDEVGKLGRA